MLILGLGLTGLSCVRFLRRHGVAVSVWDTRTTPPGAELLSQQFPQVQLRTGPLDAEQLAQVSTIVISPGIALSTPAVAAAIAAGVEVIGDIELFARHVDAPVVAITGSNGKSTVTTMVGDMARAAGWSVGVGGNIGLPALDLLEQGHQLYVLELSSFQLETTRSLNAVAATVLNISADHLDRYDGFEGYRQTKLALYQQTQCCIENSDNPLTYSGCDNAIRFGLAKPNAGHYGLYQQALCCGEHKRLELTQLPLVGSHNYANALAALALADAADIPAAASKQALIDFVGLAHRCQLVATKAGVRYVNDSKATNVGATVAALAGLTDEKGQVFLIAGGDAKGADLTELKPLLQPLAGVFTLGKDGPEIQALVTDAIAVTSIDEAVQLAAEQAKHGDIVLLSPACASLDMFRNFEQRGDHFIAAVEALPC
ncbi:UDP-N-acetylmuramoyl-L-alanine--D-glutamate ligase [Ferrimonas lipolytica]|uniref:UDP-N-acetylmuramoylalanine--D-glutamate ligase n=1 Tax=Ferrimonas lipolytica TaxID=2724191 RepID=A0A6H1UIL9_9GAMM|nr:UDP-N-acetylmuramoyl-L-alanine--D-glutamate ligase [Ferrimonas lipolytica]QIZ78957.1 UDP-N-acetylmuramoyl-L-alanine--D-glutamate ligase [Ferrimonas lipolytica]